jgi:Arc/MetJ-type ribon-helix-helix transcriptional regulator
MTIDVENTTVEAVLPTQLVAQMESLVAQGWFPGIDDLIADAVRRFLETHSPESIGSFVWQDVEWGLHGTD